MIARKHASRKATVIYIRCSWETYEAWQKFFLKLRRQHKAKDYEEALNYLLNKVREIEPFVV